LTKIGISAVSKTSRSVLAQQQSGAARLRNKLLEEIERIEGLRSIERVKAIDHSFSTSHVDEAEVGFQPTPFSTHWRGLVRNALLGKSLPARRRSHRTGSAGTF